MKHVILCCCNVFCITLEYFSGKSYPRVVFPHESSVKASHYIQKVFGDNLNHLHACTTGCSPNQRIPVIELECILVEA